MTAKVKPQGLAGCRRASGSAGIETWFFDLDNTLYPARYNLFTQVEQRMGVFIARRFGLSLPQARALQKTYFRDYGTTLRGLMIKDGLEPNAFLDYVHDVDVTAIPRDERLSQALEALAGTKIVFTNATTAHARRVLERLGIAHHFGDVFDIFAAEFVPKPMPEVYDALIRRYRIDPTTSLMVDDIARNLLPAAVRGMVTVWIRTSNPWAREGSDDIAYVTDDLAGWLSEYRGRPGDGSPNGPPPR